MENTLSSVKEVGQELERILGNITESATGPAKATAADILASDMMSTCMNLGIHLTFILLIVVGMWYMLKKVLPNACEYDQDIGSSLTVAFGGIGLIILAVAVFFDIQEILKITYHPAAWLAQKMFH